MPDLTPDGTFLSALAIVLALPLVLVAMGELQERLRQRRSPYLPVVVTLRNWLLPLVVVWVALALLLDLGTDDLAVRLAATGAVVAAAVAALAAVRVLVAAIRDRPRVAGQRAVPQLLLALPRALIIFVVFYVLLDSVWGVDLSAAFTALGVTSLVVSFALQDTLSGLASGMLLLTDQPFQPGDWVQFEDLEGRVVDVNWRSTRIETRGGDLVVVPNASLASATVTNFDRPAQRHRVSVPVQVAYLNAPSRAIEMLEAAARSTPGVRMDPAPVAQVTAVDDPLMTYVVHMWIDDYAIQPRVVSDFGALVWYWSERLRVPLPSPAQDLYLYDGTKVAQDAEVTPDQLKAALRTAPLLGSLADEELDDLASGARRVTFRAGEQITSPGGRRWDLHVLVDGEATLLADEGAEGAPIPVVDLADGELFGMTSEVEELGVELTVRAVTDCVVVVVDGARASSVIGRSRALSGAIEQLGAIRRRRLTRALMRSHVASDLGGGLDDEGSSS